jgi:hypothetical protein
MGFSFFGVIPQDAVNRGAPAEEETIKISAGIQPNLTREGSPMVLALTGSDNTWTDPSTGDLVWQFLYGLDADDFRVAYLDELGNWKLVPFQIDERAYWRGYEETLGYTLDATLNIGKSEVTVDRADVTTWFKYRENHRFGRDIDIPNQGYKEPTRQECEESFWYFREAENYVVAGGTDLDNSANQETWAQHQAALATEYALELDSVNHDTILTPINASRRQQLEHRVDYDDEVCFMAKNGRLATTSDWYDVNTYPERIRINIQDPVDGGQAWMYIYKKSDADCQSNPYNTEHFYIPTGGEDLVSWDPVNLKITAQKYELGFSATNMDLITDVSIKNDGQPTRNLMTSAEKFFASAHGRLYAELSYSGITASLNAEAHPSRM